jgi:Virus neck protein
MATNFYFNNFKSRGEQGLIEDLIIESIRMYGIDLYYLPRTVVNYSNEFREQEYSTFNQALGLEMYIKNVDGFDGEGEFLSSFGVEVREQITFSVAVRTFNAEVGNNITRVRPLESDLIWFPLRNALYTIKYVNVRPVFYQMGALQFYDVVCELFEYSSEVFNTGVFEIDNTYNSLLTTATTFDINAEDGSNILTETGDMLYLEEYMIDTLSTNAQNDFFGAQSLEILDFTHKDPFSESDRRA